MDSFVGAKKVWTYLLGALGAAVFVVLLSSSGHAEGFTAEQAASGKVTFEKNCQVCHAADLTGNANFPPLTGERFMSRWGSRTAGDLFNFISRRMPFDRPGQLAQEDYVEIIAYWLSFNGHAPGTEPLTDSGRVVLRP